MDRGEAMLAAPSRVNRREGFGAHGLGKNAGPSAAYTPKGCPPQRQGPQEMLLSTHAWEQEREQVGTTSRQPGPGWGRDPSKAHRGCGKKC